MRAGEVWGQATRSPMGLATSMDVILLTVCVPILQTPVDEQEAQSVPNIEYLLPNIGRTAASGDASGEPQGAVESPHFHNAKSAILSFC